MENGCSEDRRREFIAGILERIPRSDEETVLYRRLCPAKLVDDPTCASCVITLLTFLEVFDVITTAPDGNKADLRIKARSQTASYFLSSLAAYIRKNLPLVSNWEREGVGSDLSLSSVLASGSQFVYLMEYKRTVEHGDRTPIRQVFVSQAVIKAKIRGRHEPVYLVQYDPKAQQFQLIGGRKRSTDPDALTVMQREIEEELAQNHFKYHQDYEVRELVSDLQSIELSLTFGAYSEYHFTVYQAFIKRRELVLGPNDRWVTLPELLSGTCKGGGRIFTPSDVSYILELDKRLPGGLNGLRLSLDQVQSRPLAEIIRERRWELVGITVGIIGIVLTILFFLVGRQ